MGKKAIDIPVVKAVDLLHKTVEEMFAFPHDFFILEFVDHSFATTKQRTIWSWILWEIHREYEDTPLLARHHIQNQVLTPKTHIDILSTIKNDCIETYDPEATGTMVGLNELVHKTFNNMYNILTVKLEAYVTGANAVDVLEVLKHPEIAKANETIFTTNNITAHDIAEQHDRIAKVLSEDKSLTRNSVAIAYRNSLVKGAQLLQCISSRGFMSEINNQNFKVPMLHSYSTGMRTLANYACDSRMATISALTQDTTMRDLQYTNRSFQILNSDTRNIYYKDCGTIEGSTIIIDSKKKLKQYLGMYHMVDNKWILIDTNNDKLLNTPLYVRTMVSCKNHDRHGVCIKCLGELGTSIISSDNLGQFVAARVQEKQSQGGLSVKHFSANAFDSVHNLDDNGARHFFIDDNTGTDIYVKPSVVSGRAKIVFKAEEVEEVLNAGPLIEKNIQFPTSRYSKISVVTVCKDDGGVIEKDRVDIGGLNTAYFSTEAIYYLYLSTQVVEIDDNGDWVLDMSSWDYTKPFLKLPRKKIDLVQAAKRFDNFLKGNKKTRSANRDLCATDYEDFGEAIMGIQDLTIEHSPTPVTHLQVMLYGLLAANPAQGDYRLPDPTNRSNSKFVTFVDKVTYGNIAVAMAYERQGGILTQPTSYNLTKRSSSGYEWFVLKGEKLRR